MQASAMAGTDFANAAQPRYQIAEELVQDARAVAKKSATEGLQTDLFIPGGDLDWGEGDVRLGFNISRIFGRR